MTDIATLAKISEKSYITEQNIESIDGYVPMNLSEFNSCAVKKNYRKYAKHH